MRNRSYRKRKKKKNGKFIIWKNEQTNHKTSMDEIGIRMEVTEEGSCEHEDRVIEMIQCEQDRKMMKTNEQNLKHMRNHTLINWTHV